MTELTDTYEVVVDGVPLCATYRLAVTNYTDKPPATRTSTVSIPGRDGVLDLSEWLTGAPVFDKRTITITLSPLDTHDWASVETTLTALRNMLHGRRLEFTLSWDEGYTYTGRFEVTSQTLYDETAAIKLTITADPYKSRGVMHYELDGELGKTYIIDGPAHAVVPTITCQTRALVNINGRTVDLQPGVWINRDLELHNGKNRVTVNTTPDYGTAIWRDYAGLTWEQLDGTSLAYIGRAGKNRLKGLKWSSLAGKKWQDMRGTWHEHAYVDDAETHNNTTVMLDFDWKDI